MAVPICCHQHSPPFTVLRTAIVPVADLFWFSNVAQLSLSHPAIHSWVNPIAGLVNIITGLCLRSTLGQSSLPDFARDPPLGKTHCRTCKHHRRTLLAIHPWANIIAGLYSRSTLGQTSSQDLQTLLQEFARDQPDPSLTDPQPP